MKRVRLLTLIAAAALLAGSWILVARGGVGGILAWVLLLPVVVPLASLVVLGIAAFHVLRKRRIDGLGASTIATALVGLWPAAWLVGALRIAYPADADDTAPALVARLPVDVPAQVYWGGDALADNAHAVTIDQRWAYDLVVPPAATGSPRLEDYGCYGVEVVAPIDGTVVLAHDGEPDAVPAQPPSNPTAPLGNAVAIASRAGTFVIVAHLRPGSVAVREGDVVSAGTPIGRCGNSGNTSEPHIHIHHQRQDPRSHPVGFAEGLPLSFLVEGVPRMPRGGVEIDGERIVLRGERLSPPPNSGVHGTPGPAPTDVPPR